MDNSVMADQLFVGPIIHSDEEGKLIIHHHAAMEIKDGKILRIIEEPKPTDLKCSSITFLEPGQFLIPGFIDCHTHAVQYPNLGLGYDKKLLDWLEHYTFPLEKKYSDPKFAAKVFDLVVKRTLQMGTTTACYFASLYESSSLILGQKVAEYGQRAFIGKVNMNCHREDGYYEDTETSIENTHKFIQSINKMENPLIRPVITPRFALSCDMKLMTELSKIAKENNILIQSHISENEEEIQAVRNAYKHCSSYAGVYDEAGLLTERTLLAHGVHLRNDELALLRKRETAIIHCPSSNTCLSSGLCDVQELKTHKIKIGLGTDVSGGPSYGILEAMKSALQVSTHIAFTKPKDDYKTLNHEDVFYLATLGGAKALAIDDRVGNFMPGKEFDAILVDVNTPDSPLDSFLDYTLREQFQRFIYSGDDRNIIQVFVNGRKVSERSR